MNVRPKIILGVTAVIILLILFSLAQEMNRRWQVQQQAARLDQEARQLHKNVIELEHLNQYFRTDDYQERLAREKLNFKAPGEHVVLIPEEDIAHTEYLPQEEESLVSLSVPLRWWHMFFVDEGPPEI
jgi:cell division protein FtsB